MKIKEHPLRKMNNKQHKALFLDWQITEAGDKSIKNLTFGVEIQMIGEHEYKHF
jgi:hypothetical protein